MNTFATATRFGRNRTEIYSKTAMTDDQIRAVAPSVFAEGAHESRSARYTFIPTIEVLQGLRREGFEVFGVMQSRCRIPGKQEFTKHLLKLRRLSDNAGAGANAYGSAAERAAAAVYADGRARAVNDVTPEINLVNSHDGTSSYELIAGFLRLICLNGLMVPDSIVQSVKVAHKGDVVREVIEGAFTVIDNFGAAIESREGMRAVTLTEAEQRVFAGAALTARFGTAEERTNTETGRVAPIPVTVDQVLRVRRHDDRGADLWTTFNRVQEGTVRGGDRHAQLTEGGRRLRTRAVTGIAQNVSLNRALWELAEGMRALKTGAADAPADLLAREFVPATQTLAYSA